MSVNNWWESRVSRVTVIKAIECLFKQNIEYDSYKKTCAEMK